MSRRQRRKRQAQSAAARGKERGAAQGKGKKWLFYGLLGLLGVLLVTGCIICQQVTAYLESQAFRNKLEEKTGDALGARAAEFGAFDWSGLSTKNPSMRVLGEGMVQRVEVKDFALDVGIDWWARESYDLNRVHFGSMAIDLDLTKPFEPRKSPKKKPGPFADFLPNKAELRGLDVADLDVNLNTQLGAFSAEALKIKVQGKVDEYHLYAENGLFTLPFPKAPQCRLKSVLCSWMEEKCAVSGGEIALYESGKLSFAGDALLKIEQREDEAGEITLVPVGLRKASAEGSLSGVKVVELVDEDWQKRLEGEIVGSFHAVMESGKPRISGDVELVGGVLTALPVLDKLAVYLQNADFRRIAFDQARMHYAWENEVLKITNIELRSRGLVEVEGQVEIRGQEVEGVFQLGLSRRNLRFVPGAEGQVFQAGKNGMSWATVRVSGTFENMKEDLSQRLIAAAGGRMFKMAEQVIGLAIKPAGKAKNISDEGSEKVDELLPTLQDAGKKGVNLLTDSANGLLDATLGIKQKPTPEKKSAEDEKEEKRQEGEGKGLLNGLPGRGLLPF